MLESSNPDVAQVASGALRNLVFKNLENKISVQKYGGIAKVLNLLKRTESTETKRQVTGRKLLYIRISKALHSIEKLYYCFSVV